MMTSKYFEQSIQQGIGVVGNLDDSIDNQNAAVTVAQFGSTAYSANA